MNPSYIRSRGLKIIPEDAGLIQSFLEDVEANTDNISLRTLNDLKKGLELWTDELTFSALTETALKHALSVIRKRGYKPNTLHHHIGKLKRFLTWMNDNGHTEISLKTIQKISAPGIDYNTKKPSQMLEEEEVRLIIDTCRHPRDKALFSMLYEGSFRPVELVEMTWDQVKFDEYGCVINTAQKTGKPRYIRLVTSRAYLAAWQASYPLDRTNDAHVFVSLYKPHEPIGYRGMQNLLATTVKKSGLKKKVSLYLFRHSRITNMLQQEYPESAIKLQAWGNLRTPMLATYAHLDGTYVDGVMLERAGIVQTEKKKKSDSLKAEQCPHCHTINPPGGQFCTICGRGLTEEATTQIEQERGAIRAAGGEFVRAADVERIVKDAVTAALSGKK
jgi:site-specific recombinase XerD